MAEIAKLALALVKAQLKACAVEKDAKNEHFGYRYASAESVIQEGRTTLAAQGLAFVQASYTFHLLERELDRGKETARAKLCITYHLIHESGEMLSFERDWCAVESQGRPIDKAMGGALTTSLSYAIRDLLLLPRDNEYASMDRRAPPDEREEEGPKSESRPSDRVHPFVELLPIIQERKVPRDDVIARVDRADLLPEERVALDLVVMAYAATKPDGIASLGSKMRTEIRDERLRDWALKAIRPAWDALQSGDPDAKGAA